VIYAMGPPRSLLSFNVRGEEREPGCRVICALRSDHPDAVLKESQKRPADLPLRKRSIVDVLALDQQIWPPLGRPKRTNLKPQSTAHKRQVEIEHSLALYDRPFTGQVVADEKPALLDARAAPSEGVEHARLFTRVDHHVATGTHPRSFSSVARALSHNSFREAKRK
jgi:hypothetical protein